MTAPPIRKQSRARLLERAWTASQTRPLHCLLSAEQEKFWFQLLLEIHDYAPDGIRLRLGAPDARYSSLEHLVSSFQGTPGGIQNLLTLGLILELPGYGIAIPDRFDLLPAPKRPRGTARRPASLRLLSRDEGDGGGAS